MTGRLCVTPDCDTLTGRCTFNVLSVRSVVKSFTAVTRVDRRLREVHQLICVR